MATIEEMQIKVTLEVADLNAKSAQLKSELNGLGKAADDQKAPVAGLGTHIKTLVGAFVGMEAISKATDWLKESATAFAADQAAAAQTEAVLKSTSGAAGVTAGQIDKMTESLKQKTAVDDLQIRAGANMLLTFTNVRNEVGKGNDIYNQATSTVMDMSRALGEDTKSAAMQLGKALNDPVAGVTALRRVGVQLSDTQKQQIKDFMAVGDAAGAQKVILGELNKEFGGSATAYAKSYAGQMAALKITWEDAGKSIIASLMPALKMFMAALQTSAEFIKNNINWLLPLVGVIGGLVVVVKAASFAHEAYEAAVKGAELATKLATAAQWLMNAALDANPIGIVIVAVAALVAGLTWFFTQTKVGQQIWSGFVKFLSDSWNNVVKFFQDAINAIVTFAKNNWGLLLSIFIGPMGLVLQFVVQHWKQIQTTFSEGINAVIKFFTDFPKQILTALGNLGTLLFDAGKNILQGLLNGIESQVASILAAAGKVASTVANAFKGVLGIHSPSTVFADFGMNIGQGLINGLQAITPEVGKAVAGLSVPAINVAAGMTPSGMGAASSPAPSLPRSGGAISITNNNYSNADPASIAAVMINSIKLNAPATLAPKVGF